MILNINIKNKSEKIKKILFNIKKKNILKIAENTK